MKRNYPTNLTDSQYNTIVRIIGDKRKRKCSLRSVFDAMLYLLKTGCQWRMLPPNFPSWKLVYYYFCKWCRDVTLEEIHDVLRDCLRGKRGRKRSPSVVERSFSWLESFRRLTKDYGRTCQAAQNMIYIAFIALMGKWL